MEPRLVRHRVDRIDGDRPGAGKAQAIAIKVIERNLFDGKGCQGPARVPSQDGLFGDRVTIRLGQHEPPRPEDEPNEVVWLVAVTVGLISLALGCDRHAQDEGSFAFPYVSPFLFPTDERSNRAGAQPS